MRFPTLFRTPRHQQFHIEPRYYDPIKEQIKERTERIKKEMDGELDENYTSQISFKKRSVKKTPASSLLQLSIAVVLIILTFGWLEFGNLVFEYALYLIIPVYLIYRLRKMRRSR
jgi:hypothetical protein